MPRSSGVCEEEIRDASKQTFLKKQERAMAKKLPESSLFDVRQDPRSGEAMGERHSFAADDDCSAAVIRCSMDVVCALVCHAVLCECECDGAVRCAICCWQSNGMHKPWHKQLMNPYVSLPPKK